MIISVSVYECAYLCVYVYLYMCAIQNIFCFFFCF